MLSRFIKRVLFGTPAEEDSEPHPLDTIALSATEIVKVEAAMAKHDEATASCRAAVERINTTLRPQLAQEVAHLVMESCDRDANELPWAAYPLEVSSEPSPQSVKTTAPLCGQAEKGTATSHTLLHNLLSDDRYRELLVEEARLEDGRQSLLAYHAAEDEDIVTRRDALVGKMYKMEIERRCLERQREALRQAVEEAESLYGKLPPSVQPPEAVEILLPERDGYGEEDKAMEVLHSNYAV